MCPPWIRHFLIVKEPPHAHTECGEAARTDALGCKLNEKLGGNIAKCRGRGKGGRSVCERWRARRFPARFFPCSCMLNPLSYGPQKKASQRRRGGGGQSARASPRS